MMKIQVVINQQQKLFPEQEKMILKEYGNFEKVEIPMEGINLEALFKMADELEDIIIIASHIPALTKFLFLLEKDYYIFHKNIRDKKELPNGDISMTVSWVLV